MTQPMVEIPRIPGVITIDLRPLRAAIMRTHESMRKALRSPSVQRAIRVREDREHIRRIAARELEQARAHLERSVDAIYADLGLERLP